MKKKALSILLGVAMVSTLLTACGKEDEPVVESGSEVSSVVESSEVTPEVVEGEAIPTPAYYYSFDAADGTDGIQPTAQTIGGDPILSAVEKDINFIPGVKGDALYVDGVTGYKLTDVNGVGDTYSVSFWLYATRFANYMPTIQFGPDIHGDATGGQHYLNITRAEWGKDGAATFPCIWAYDQLDDALWPNWAPDDNNEHLKEWVNITLVVDQNNVSADESMLVAKLYVNGEEMSKTDSDGNIIPIHVVNGCMAPSDNFDFLVGVNYWDAIFKGAIDELYIFDQALTAGQALSLYQAGDTTVPYQAPERVIEVKQTEGALDQIGSVTLDNGWWSDWSQGYEIKDGETKQYTLMNYSSGAASWNNYVMIFSNQYSEAHVDPNAAEGHEEYAAVRADAFGWTPAGDIDPAAFTYSWDNWGTWNQQVMVEAKVTITVKRDGNMLYIEADNVDINTTSNKMTAAVPTTLDADKPCFLNFTCEGAYVEVLDVQDAIVIEKDPAAIASIGRTDLLNGWWTDWSEATELADGATKTITFKNYSDGVNNWDNFVVMFTNEYSAAGTDPNTVSDAHVEYAAVRADAYGWGGDYVATYETSWGDNWAAFVDMMKAACVKMTITRNGGELTIDCVIVDRFGAEGSYKAVVTSTLTADAPCYFLLTCEECYIDILSIE